MSNLSTLFDRYKALVVFDTETSGLDFDSDQIIELAALRVERTATGGLRIAGKMDTFIKLPEGETLPENIVSLTGITDERLQTEGVQPVKAAGQIAKLMQNGPTLMIAHNAQFDACFLRGLLRGQKVGRIDWLDSLTVYKDRRAYPHKLANAIIAYDLTGKVQNSHRAIDDVLALFEVLKAMDDEREALYSQLTPEQRQQTLILRDADELGELITNREEAMAAETMLTNGCVMKHIADDVDKADEMEIRFYSEASNPATYTPTAKWDAAGGKILKDLEAMIRMLTKRGLRASDLVCSPDVADTIINDAAVQKLLDNRRIEIGNVEPELLPDGAAIVARLNVLGRIISVISYDLTYTDDEGNDKLYIPSGKCVLTAPGAGRTAYGAVSQVEQSDGEFHTYAGRRVPKYVSSAEGNSRTLTISSRPLMIPNNKNPFIVADVLTD